MKVQNEMSTRISVDAVSAIGSMKAFRNAIKGAGDAWRAQEMALRNSGNFTEAAKTRLNGLNQVIDLQKAKIEELRQRQEGLNLSNKKQGDQFLKLERQIQQANRQLASYESQATRARSATRYQVSGLAALQTSYRRSQSASAAYIARLTAEGRSASATVEKYRTLRSSLTNLESQYRKQEFLLRQVAHESGKDSEAYIKQREELDKTATSIAKTKSEMRSLESENAKLQPTGIKRIDSAVIKLKDHTGNLREHMRKAFDSIKNNAVAVATSIGTVGAAVASSAEKAGQIQKTMIENQNLMITAGEKSATVQKEVNQMYSNGEKYSVQYGMSQKTIASGYQELIKRGYDGKQVLGAMKSIIEASKASGDDFNDTMKVTTSTLEAFGMRSETTAGMMRNTAKAADILAKAADVTSTNFQEIGYGMSFAGSTAKQTGISMRETAASLGVLSNNGLQATQAGTGLRRVMTRLANPTNTAKAALDKYGISVDNFKDKSGKLKSVSTIFKDIDKHVPKAERFQLLNKVFGQTGQNAAAILARTADLSEKNSNSLDHVENQLKTAYSEDYVGKMARRNMRSAKNSSDRFKYAAEAIQIEIGRNMLPAISKASVSMANAFGRKDTQKGLKVLSKGIGSVASAVVSLITLMGKHTTTVKIFGGALLSAFSAFKLLQGYGAVVNTLSKFPKTMLLVKNSILGVKDAIKVLTLGFNPWVIGIGVAVAALTALYKHSKAFRKFVNGMASATKKVMGNIGKWFSNAAKTIGKNIKENQKQQQKAAKQQQRQQRETEKQEAASAKRRQKAWNNYWKNVGRNASNGWKNLKKNGSSALRTLDRDTTRKLRNMERTWDRHKRTLGRSSRNIWRSLEKDAQNGHNRVTRWFSRMNIDSDKSVQRMAKDHPRTFNAMYKQIEDRSKAWHDFISGHWSRLGDDTADVAKDMGNTNRSLFSDMYDKLNDLTNGGMDNIKNAWNKALSNIHDAVVNIGGTIHKAWDNLMNGIIDVFGGMVNGVIDGINWVLNKVGGSGNLAHFNLKKFAKGSNGPISKHEVALLNDAPGSEYREMVHKHSTGKTFMLPAKRNIIMPLEPGDEVLDGHRVAEAMRTMGVTPHAGGAIGSFFSGVFDKTKDALEDATDWVDKALKNVVEFGKELFEHFTKAVSPKGTDALGSGLKTSLPGFFAKRFEAWLKKQLDKLNTDNPPGTGVERWRPVILRAFAALGVAPADWKVNKLLRQIATESGGDPHRWQQIHDQNSGGNEGRGLLQFAGSTWAADALPGHTDWRSGYNEILAAIHVLERGGEGGWGNVGNGHGWENGGLITQHGMYEVGEYNHPEMIIPLDMSKRGRAYSLLAQVIDRFKGEDSDSLSSTSENSQVQVLSKKFDALLAQNQQLLNLVDKLIGVTDSANNPTARYKRTQRDINMAHAQSFI